MCGLCRSLRLRFSNAGKRRHVSNSDLPRQQTHSQTGVTCRERKGPTAYSISFLVGFILVFAESFMKCDDEPSAKASQDAVMHPCVGVEVIPQGPPEVITWPMVVWKWLREK